MKNSEKCDHNATEMRPSFISDHFGGANKMVDHVAEVGNMAPLTIEQMRDMVRCMTERAEAAEARCETFEKMVKEYQDVIVPGYRERAERASEIASDLCDDFTDFVTGGVHNAAPYCANQCPECVNAHGWCNGDNSVCRGFLPKAAGIKKEE